MLNPYNEEKGEVRNSGSCSASAATSPSEDVRTATESQDQSFEAERTAQMYLYQLADGASGEYLSAIRALRARIIDQKLLTGPLNLEEDHPLEEVGWSLFAVLIYHHGLANAILKSFAKDPSSALPNEVLTLCKAVQQCKWRLFQERQKLDQSHKEVCSPVLERCR